MRVALLSIEAGKIGARLGVVGSELKSVLEIGAGCFGFSGAGFEDAEIVPSVGIICLKLKGLFLFFDGFGQ